MEEFNRLKSGFPLNSFHTAQRKMRKNKLLVLQKRITPSSGDGSFFLVFWSWHGDC
jgi:hypothetical protein